MRFVFNELKSAQAAAFLLKKSKGQMNYMLLVKLLYEADRLCLTQRGFTITGDKPYSMKNGPALSTIVNLLSQKVQDRPKSLWHTFIPRPKPEVYECRLTEDPGDEWLSQTEKEFLDTAFKKFGHMDEFAVSKLMHSYPEFEEPDGSSIPIQFDDILRSEKVDEDLIDAIDREVNGVARLKK